MKLTFVISHITSGGGERVLTMLANYFVAQGGEVSVITFAHPTEKPFYGLDDRICLRPLGTMYTANGGYFSRLTSLANRVFTLRKTIKSIAPDTVISFLTETNILTLVATGGLGIPVIVSERTDPYVHKLSWIVHFLRKVIYRFARYAVLQTTTAQQYFSYLGDKVKVIANPLSTPSRIKIANEARKKPTIIISVGRLCPNKGFQDLILAFHQIAPRHENLRLIIYGEGSYRAALEKLIHSLQLEKKVFLPGAASLIEDKLLQADIFVFPSYYEGFPNALCEALAVGLPVVASDCNGNKEIIKDGDNGLLFPMRDYNKLAATLGHLLDTPALREKLSQQAPQIIQYLALDKIANKWGKLFL